MPEVRFATSEELALVRERVARVEGGHDHLSTQMAQLSDRIDSTRDSLSQKIDEASTRTRVEVGAHFDRALQANGDQVTALSRDFAAIAGNIRFMKWTFLASVTIITGLLGWGQIGDWAWGEVKNWYVSVYHHTDPNGQSYTTITMPSGGKR